MNEDFAMAPRIAGDFGAFEVAQNNVFFGNFVQAVAVRLHEEVLRVARDPH
jgi:hypothetical protein